jgi:hypothetical protein
LQADGEADVNAGFFVRHADEYEWLCRLLSKKTMKKLLAKEEVGNRMERVELPGLLAVHFVRPFLVLAGHLPWVGLP